MPEVVLLHVPALPRQERGVRVLPHLVQVVVERLAAHHRQVEVVPPGGQARPGPEHPAPCHLPDGGEEVVPIAAERQLDRVAPVELVGSGAEHHRLQRRPLRLGVPVQLVLVELFRPALWRLGQPEQVLPLPRVRNPVGRQQHRMVRQTERAGHGGGQASVIVGHGARGQHGEGVHAGVRREAGDGRGVDATTEHQSHLGVGGEAFPHGLAEQLAVAPHVLLFRSAPLGLGLRQRPVAALVYPPGRQVDLKDRGGRHVLDPFEPGQRRIVGEYRRRAHRRLGQGTLPVQPAGAGRMLEQRLDLRAEHHQAVAYGVEQRLDAEPVAGENQPATPPVVDGDAEHAAHLVEEVEVVPQVERKQHLAVRAAAQRPGRQARRELTVVVDLPVAHQGNRAVGADERLAPAVRVDQCQPGERQADLAGRARAEHLLVVGSAVGERERHPTEDVVRPGRERLTVQSGQTRDSAHWHLPAR